MWEYTSIYQIEYISDSSLYIINWLVTVISDVMNLSIDIISDSDDCDWDNLVFLRYYDTSINDSGSSSTCSYVSVLSLWIVIWQTQREIFDELKDFVEDEDSVENFVVNEDFAENEGLTAGEDFAEYDCNW